MLLSAAQGGTGIAGLAVCPAPGVLQLSWLLAGWQTLGCLPCCFPRRRWPRSQGCVYEPVCVSEGSGSWGCRSVSHGARCSAPLALPWNMCLPVSPWGWFAAPGMTSLAVGCGTWISLPGSTPCVRMLGCGCALQSGSRMPLGLSLCLAEHLVMPFTYSLE